jgi:hypothetical protein
LIPFSRDELAMPRENRVGGDDPGQIQERLSADSLAGHGQPATLVIGQPDPSVAELFEKDAVLLAMSRVPLKVDCGSDPTFTRPSPACPACSC